jgi:hypothetical protein
VTAALVFGIAGGGALGGMVTGSGDPAAGDRLDAALDRLDEERPTHVAVHCAAAEDATLAAQVLAGLGPPICTAWIAPARSPGNALGRQHGGAAHRTDSKALKRLVRR